MAQNPYDYYRSLDPTWYDDFASQHGGTNPVDYYGPTSGGSMGSAYGQARRDRDYGDQFASQYGRAPSADDWHYYATGGRYSPRGVSTGSGEEPAKPTWWGEPMFGSGVIQWPGMDSPIDLRRIKYFNQIDPQYRSWFSEAVNAMRDLWPSAAVPPVTWMQPNLAVL